MARRIINRKEKRAEFDAYERTAKEDEDHQDEAFADIGGAAQSSIQQPAVTRLMADSARMRLSAIGHACSATC